MRRIFTAIRPSGRSFQSTHPARGATPGVFCSKGGAGISIHAPREGCDGITAVYEELEQVFQSTHPARGATRRAIIRRARNLLYFNPRTPRGVRLLPWCVTARRSSISIHAPREGCDTGRWARFGYFAISIHAPREGCDWSTLHTSQSGVISIHAPREGCDDLRSGFFGLNTEQFQSTHPARGATSTTLQAFCKASISIHAPREGCDSVILLSIPSVSTYFNPRTPRGVRLGCFNQIQPMSDFNPRTPRGVRQQTLPKSREFAWLNLLICTRGRRLSIQKQTRLCSIKLSFMLFGCEPAGEGVSSWTSHATKSKVRLEGRSA